MEDLNSKQTKPKVFHLNKKTGLGILALLMGVGLVIMSSFFPFIIDPNQVIDKKFWSNEILTMGIVLLGMIASIGIGQASNAQDERSEIAKARRKFDKSVVRITNINHFCQWVKRVFQPSDLIAFENRIIRETGIRQYEIVNLSIPELKSLIKKSQKIGDKYYSAITREQFDTLVDLKTGKINIKFVEPQYYLTCSTILSESTISEKASRENQKKQMLVTGSVIWRLILTVVVAVIFTSLVYDATSDVPKAVALMNFFSRMVSLFTSIFCGYKVGCDENDIDADFINMRILVHDQYVQDNGFKGLSIEEEAKEEFKQRVKEENIKDMKENHGIEVSEEKKFNIDPVTGVILSEEKVIKTDKIISIGSGEAKRAGENEIIMLGSDKK